MRNFSNKMAVLLRNSAVFGAFAAATLSGGVAHAATQGTLGATSTGTIEIRASVPNRARITGLEDVTWTAQDPGTAATNTQNVCVWSNTANKQYTVTATGDGASSAFTLANSTLTVPYSVEWAGSTGAATGTALASGTASAAFTSAASQQICANGPANSASLIVGISSDDLGTMQSETTYLGVLTLVVTPQ